MSTSCVLFDDLWLFLIENKDMEFQAGYSEIPTIGSNSVTMTIIIFRTRPTRSAQVTPTLLSN